MIYKEMMMSFAKLHFATEQPEWAKTPELHGYKTIRDSDGVLLDAAEYEVVRRHAGPLGPSNSRWSDGVRPTGQVKDIDSTPSPTVESTVAITSKRLADIVEGYRYQHPNLSWSEAYERVRRAPEHRATVAAYERAQYPNFDSMPQRDRARFIREVEAALGLRGTGGEPTMNAQTQKSKRLADESLRHMQETGVSYEMAMKETARQHPELV
jgi:hypothetical protein